MATLMLHRDVLKGFGQLPTKVQKKVSELIRKFQEDSTQASIHLEKVEDTVDDKVRSARVGDDWRAILIAPQQGDTFLLMHVDHHDEAYRWCRNKRFEAHGTLGMLQVFDIDMVEEAAARSRTSSDIALKEALDSYPLDRLSDDQLFQAGVPRALIPAVRAIRNDAAFDEVVAYLPLEAGQVLFWVVAGRTLEEALEETLGALDAGTARPDSPGDFSKLATVPSGELVLVDGEEELRRILAEDIEAWRVFLHPYQRKLKEWDVKGPIKISGSAGTGKTVVLMHRAVHLAGLLKDEKSKVLVTTFSANLSVTIEDLIRKLNPTAARRIEVTNLHQLARTICLRAGWQGRVADDQDLEGLWAAVFDQHDPATVSDGAFTADFIRQEYGEVVEAMGIDSEEDYLTAARTGRARLSRPQRRQLWIWFLAFNRLLQKRGLLTFEGTIHQARLIAERGGFSQYRHVLVDEIQDFGLEGLRLISALSPNEEGVSNPLCVVGDGHQRITRQAKIPLSRAGINVVGRSRRLKINYRTSEQIRRWSLSLLTGMDIDDLDGGHADTTGDRSVFSASDPLAVKVDTWEQAGVVIADWVDNLCTEHSVRTHEICIAPMFGEVRTALNALEIPSLALQANKADPGLLEPGVRLGDMRRIKGLEFRAVAMVIDGRSDDRHRMERYVAATRAREWLLVVEHNGGD